MNKKSNKQKSWDILNISSSFVNLFFNKRKKKNLFGEGSSPNLRIIERGKKRLKKQKRRVGSIDHLPYQDKKPTDIYLTSEELFEFLDPKFINPWFSKLRIKKQKEFIKKLPLYKKIRLRMYQIFSKDSLPVLGYIGLGLVSFLSCLDFRIRLTWTCKFESFDVTLTESKGKIERLHNDIKEPEGIQIRAGNTLLTMFKSKAIPETVAETRAEKTLAQRWAENKPKGKSFGAGGRIVTLSDLDLSESSSSFKYQERLELEQTIDTIVRELETETRVRICQD